MERKKIILICSFLIYATLLVSQEFYLKPFLESKINLTQKETTDRFQSNPIFKYKQDRLIPGKYIINSSALLIGFQTRNKKSKFETGINYTQLSTGATVYYLQYIKGNQNGFPANYITPSTYHIRNDFSLFMFPINYIYSNHRNIINEEKSYRLYLSYQLGLSFTHFISSKIYGDKLYSALYSANDTIYIRSLAGSGGYYTRTIRSLVYAAGISLRIENKKNIELFTLSVSYYYGSGSRLGTGVHIDLNTVRANEFRSLSNGTGFGISICRDFTFVKLKRKQ